MSHRSLVSTAALATVVAAAISVALLAQAPAAAQTPSSPPKATTAGKPSTPPRTSDGKPDLQGIWTDNTLTPLERPKKLGAKEFYTDEDFAELTSCVGAKRGNAAVEVGRTLSRRSICRRSATVAKASRGIGLGCLVQIGAHLEEPQHFLAKLAAIKMPLLITVDLNACKDIK
jgi:hypothetical protein